MNRHKRLTCASVKAAKVGRQGDGGRGSFGLSLLVKRTKDGELRRYWTQRYRKDRQYTSRSLGVYPRVSLEQARKLAAYYALEGQPRIVRETYGATEEQLAEIMSPVRHAIEATAAPTTSILNGRGKARKSPHFVQARIHFVDRVPVTGI